MKIEVTKKATESQIKKVITNEELSKSKRMIELFNLGLEIKEISTLMNVRYNFVYNVVSNYVNVNEIQVTKKEKVDNKKEKIIELYLQNKTNKEISIELKTNYNYVRKVIVDYKEQKESNQQVN